MTLNLPRRALTLVATAFFVAVSLQAQSTNTEVQSLISQVCLIRRGSSATPGAC